MKKINVGLCSFGMSGRIFHAPFIVVNPHFHLYSVWERSKNIAAGYFPAIKTYRTLEDMLADDQLELVVVNTPNATHYDYTKKALEAGKHVIVEKPFTIRVEEGHELILLAAKHNRKLSVYHNRRYDSDFKTVKKIVSEGWLGDIVEAEFHFDRFKENIGPKVHKETPGPGTGTLYDLGAHLIDQALQLFGKPDSIFADIGIMRSVSKVDDYFEVLLYYGKTRVRIKSSYMVREAIPAYVLHGTKGSFIKPKTDVQESMLEAGATPGGPDWGREPVTERGLLHTEKEGTIIREHITSLQGNYGEYYEGMYNAIINDQPVPVNAADALDVIQVIESAYESNKSKKVIRY
ncbi:MAG: Gfo/Idh/MocA family oxidoreductase [Ginsengibacter sp.]